MEHDMCIGKTNYPTRYAVNKQMLNFHLEDLFR